MDDKGGYTADRRLYLDADGKAVEADDPARVSLLVGENGTLPVERARELGLVDDEGNAVARAADAAEGESEAKAVAGPAETKAAKAPAKAAPKPAAKK